MTASFSSRELTTVTTAIDILEFVKGRNGTTMAELVDEFGMAKSTVHGYLSTLERNSLIVREEEEYLLGLRLANLGEHAKTRNDLYPLAESKVVELSDRLDEGANFLVPEGDRMIALYCKQNNPKDPIFTVGQHFGLHNTVSGKAVLAERSYSRFEAMLDRIELAATTQKTITDQGKLHEEIERVRKQGYSTIDGELVEGLRSVGAAVTYPDGRVFGAFGVGGPEYRIDEKRLHTEFVDVMLEVVDELEAEIERALQEEPDVN
ncbi:IclR family transcriptional regulator [Halococcus salifodinae]|uniref:Transcriptional regulator n=1 Tax=Halococcus salifodinae DSM 8989 TaxID=1227456 RepID=M0NDS5_9EURY|nr:IclR family transcriptional regulator [Halococcus salifodinae]EMA54840.1 transcriptional regulator [Halococcus salifodinae DSM 8989]